MKKNIYTFIFLLLFTKIISPQTLADKYSQAMEAFNSHRYVEANRLFDDFFDSYKLMDELNATAKYYSSEALLNIGKREGAAAGFKYLIDNFEWSNFRDKSYYSLGLIYFDLGKFAESRKTLIEFLDEYPSSEFAGSAMYWVGESFTEEGRIDDAIKFLEDAVQKRKNNKYIDYSIYTLASLYEKKGDYQNAVKYYDQLLSYFKDSPLAASSQIRIGICYFKLKDYQSSILELNNPQLSSLSDDQYSESLYLLANSYYRVHQYEDASKTYLEIISSFPNTDLLREVKYGLAWTYFQQKKYDDAFEIFNTLSNGEDSIAMKSFYWKGEAQRYAGNDTQAFSIYKEFLNRYPNSQLASGVKYQIGALYFDDENYKQAEDFLNLTQNSSDKILKARAYTLLGDMQLKKEKYSEALKQFQNALKISPISEELENRAGLGVGISQFYLKNYNESLSSLNKISERDAGFEQDKINFYQAENNFALGKYKFALEKYQAVNIADTAVGKFALYGKAYSYFNLRDYQNSAAQFSDFIKKFPKDSRITDAKLRLADSYYGSKSYAAASRIYREMFDSKNSAANPYLNYQYAQTLYKSGSAQDAINEFRNLQNRFPNSEYADKSLYVVGWIYFQKGNFNEAISNYKTVMDKYPGSLLNPIIYYSIGDSYFNMGKYDDAIENYNNVLTLYPSSNYVFDAVNGLQYSYVAQGNPQKAISVIDEFVQKNPGLSFSDQLYFKKGEIYYSSQNYEQAKTSYSKFVANYPKSKLVPDAYFWIGKSAQNLNQNEEAIFNFKKVFDSYPNTEAGAASVLEIGNIYIAQKNYDAAISIYNEAYNKMKQSPRLAEIIFMRGTAFSNKGDIKSANDSFDEVAQYYPQTIFAAKAKFEIGAIEMAAGRYSNADSYFQNLANSRSDDLGAKAQYYLGLSQFEQKKYIEAISAFVRVRTIFSAYDEWLAKSYLKMGEAYTILKDYEKAKEIYRTVLAKHKGDVFGNEAQTKLRALK